jgi:hypothetical protein
VEGAVSTRSLRHEAFFLNFLTFWASRAASLYLVACASPPRKAIMQNELSKEYIEQLLAEIKYYLNPGEHYCTSKDFLLGACFGLDMALDSLSFPIKKSQYLEALKYLALETEPYRRAKKAH